MTLERATEQTEADLSETSGKSALQQAASGAREARSTQTLLLVEDDPVSQSLMTMLLSDEGYRIEAVSSGVEALEAVQRQRFDAILMDIRMPGMNGLETTRRIRALADAEQAATTIIALTADVASNVVQEAQAAGMDHVLTKPIRVEEINRQLCASSAQRSSRVDAS